MLAHCTEKLECLPPINPFADIYVFYSRDLCCGFSESRKRRSQTFIFHFLSWKPFIVICLVLWTWHTLLEKWDWARQVNEGVYHCHVYYLLFRDGFYNYISGCFCVPITVLGLERWIKCKLCLQSAHWLMRHQRHENKSIQYSVSGTKWLWFKHPH